MKKKGNLIAGIFVACALLICAIMCRGIYIHSVDSRVSFSEIWQLKSSKQILSEVSLKYHREIEKFEAKSFDKDTEVENEEEQDIEETEDEYLPVIESEINLELEILRIETGYYEEKEKEAEEAALAEARERDKDNMSLDINEQEIADIRNEDITEEEKEEKINEKIEEALQETDNENIVQPKRTEEVIVNEKPEDNIVYIDEYTRNNNGVIEAFVPGFGWIEDKPGGTGIQIEDQGGDWNKMVGTMD